MPWHFEQIGLESPDEDLQLRDVLVATVQKRETQDVLKLLSTHLPLEANGLSHLKRVCKVKGVTRCPRICIHSRQLTWQRDMPGDDARLQIILAPPDSVSQAISQSVASTSQDTTCTRLEQLSRAARLAPVPAHAPPDRDRLESWSAVWPVSLRKRPTESHVLETQEKIRMESCIQLALHYYHAPSSPRSEDLVCPVSGAVLIDPAANTVLAVAGLDAATLTSCSTTTRLPLQHAPMRLIADLASQDTSGLPRRATPIDTLVTPEVAQLDVNVDSANQQQPAKRQRQSTAIRPAEPSAQTTAAPGSVHTTGATVPYIGVGLEMYCAVEPCLMCAMALVHSRISRVVYQLPLQAGGGLGSAASLQNVKSLNHKLDVWRCGDRVQSS